MMLFVAGPYFVKGLAFSPNFIAKKKQFLCSIGRLYRINEGKNGQFHSQKRATKLKFTCSKSAIKTVERGVKYVPVADVVLGFLLLTLNIFHTFF